MRTSKIIIKSLFGISEQQINGEEVIARLGKVQLVDLFNMDRG